MKSRARLGCAHGKVELSTTVGTPRNWMKYSCCTAKEVRGVLLSLTLLERATKAATSRTIEGHDSWTRHVVAPPYIQDSQGAIISKAPLRTPA